MKAATMVLLLLLLLLLGYLPGTRRLCSVSTSSTNSSSGSKSCWYWDTLRLRRRMPEQQAPHRQKGKGLQAAGARRRGAWSILMAYPPHPRLSTRTKVRETTPIIRRHPRPYRNLPHHQPLVAAVEVLAIGPCRPRPPLTPTPATTTTTPPPLPPLLPPCRQPIIRY